MISKDKAVELLRQHGYKSKNDCGVVMTETDNDNDRRKVKSILKAAGYMASYGFSMPDKEIMIDRII